MKLGLDVWFDPERVEAIEHDNLTVRREWLQTHLPQVEDDLLG